MNENSIQQRKSVNVHLNLVPARRTGLLQKFEHTHTHTHTNAARVNKMFTHHRQSDNKQIVKGIKFCKHFYVFEKKTYVCITSISIWLSSPSNLISVNQAQFIVLKASSVRYNLPIFTEIIPNLHDIYLPLGTRH